MDGTVNRGGMVAFYFGGGDLGCGMIVDGVGELAVNCSERNRTHG